MAPYFFRTHDGIEADLVLASGGKIEVLEIKLTSSPSDADLARIARVAEMLGAPRATLISRTRRPTRSKRLWSVNLEDYLAHV